MAWAQELDSQLSERAKCCVPSLVPPIRSRRQPDMQAPCDPQDANSIIFTIAVAQFTGEPPR